MRNDFKILILAVTLFLIFALISNLNTQKIESITNFARSFNVAAAGIFIYPNNISKSSVGVIIRTYPPNNTMPSVVLSPIH